MANFESVIFLGFAVFFIMFFFNFKTPVKYLEKNIWMIRSPSKGGLKMVNFERAFFSWFAVFFNFVFKFQDPCKVFRKANRT